MNINLELDRISKTLHRRTGYSLRHVILTMRDEGEYKPDFWTSTNLPYHIKQANSDWLNFNSDHWTYFTLFLNEACK